MHLVTTARKGLVHLVATVRKGLVHLVTTCHVNVGCVCNVASGGGEIGSPPPKPIVYLSRHDEDIGRGGIALQALLFTSWVCAHHASSCSTRCCGWYPSRNLPKGQVVLRQKDPVHVVSTRRCVGRNKQLKLTSQTEKRLILCLASSHVWTCQVARLLPVPFDSILSHIELYGCCDHLYEAESIGPVITTSLLWATKGETFQGRYFPHRARFHRHGVSCRCDKRRLQPAGDPEYGQRAECVRPLCLDDLPFTTLRPFSCSCEN